MRLAVIVLTAGLLGNANYLFGSVLLNYVVAADNFVPHVSGSPNDAVSAPVDPVSLSFTLNLDPFVDATNVSDGLTVTSLNLPQSEFPDIYSYSESNDTLFVGDSNFGANALVDGTNQFTAVILNATAAPTLLVFFYSESGYPSNLDWVSAQGSVSITPEPAPFSLLCLALFAGLGLSRSRFVMPAR